MSSLIITYAILSTDASQDQRSLKVPTQWADDDDPDNDDGEQDYACL